MRKSRIALEVQKRLIEYFVLGATARSAAEIAGINHKTASYYFHRLRKLIFKYQEEHTMFFGEIEVDESYFGGIRKGKRGRGAVGKIPVFGLLKRGGKVYVCIVTDTKTKTLMPIIRDKVVPDSIVYTDAYASYDVLDVSEFKHHRINHSEAFVDSKNHINGIENFWNQAKRHLRKFNGIPKKHFHLFLRECEWRFNNPGIAKQMEIIYNIVKGELF